MSTGVLYMFCWCALACVCVSYMTMCSPKGGDGEEDGGEWVGGRGGGKEQRQSGIIVTDRAAP